jgi:uncharacterized protein (TIGR00255 family)
MSVSGMTGFARREGALGAWSWAVEARSVNGRNLEVRFRGPSGFDALERVGREAVQKIMQRGQVTLGLQARRSEVGGAVRINHDVLARYLDAIEPLLAVGKATAPSADGLLALRGVVEAGEEDDAPEVRAEVERAMSITLGEAIEALKASRLEEGTALAPVLAGTLGRIETLVAQAETYAAEQPAALKERFERRIVELAGEAVPAERIVIEAAALASRADVREELDRLTAHVAAGRALLADAAPAGRRFDFLAQEFMREANTLCSKSASSALTAVGLDLKSAVDQLREQVANIE